jgi:hypothetical protein
MKHIGLKLMALMAPILLACPQAGFADDDTGKHKGKHQAKSEQSTKAKKSKKSSAKVGAAATTTYSLLAWNDLGMHCMDADYSVFSILPPFNNLRAQLVNASTGDLVTSGVTLSFESVADTTGSVNSISSTKTNFWQYAQPLYGASVSPDEGLAGYSTASFSAQSMALDSSNSMFFADGIPITPYDDSFNFNTYPMVKVVAKNASGTLLAEAKVVLPVSDEMTCKACHGSNTSVDAMPVGGWVNDPDPEKDYRRNILKRHDDKHLRQALYKNALATKGYKRNGLLATADSGTPVLCAGCHASNALPGTGLPGIRALTADIHKKHSMVKDPTTGLPLDSINNRTACYQCHPGSETKCLRGAMGDAVDSGGTFTMNCQSCHSTMSKVGNTKRTGWLQQPNCQACHHDGKRETAAVSKTGILKVWLDQRFATNANVPSTGFSLYRFSKGHGNVQCQGCHGSTHAEYPSSHDNDNVLAIGLQGYAGTITECTTCHTSVPTTKDGGPHGMHTIGDKWVDKHHDYVDEHDASECAYCHGSDYRGSELSKVKMTKTFKVEDNQTITYTAGQKVGCYDCHDGPSGED